MPSSAASSLPGSTTPAQSGVADSEASAPSGDQSDEPASKPNITTLAGWVSCASSPCAAMLAAETSAVISPRPEPSTCSTGSAMRTW